MLDMDRVPWLSPDRLRHIALNLLDRAGRRLGMEIRPPVPVEAIIEQVFGIHLCVENLRERYPGLAQCEDLLGATLVRSKQILIHDGLLSEPENQGRYFFTCAHELAHWVLHRNLRSGYTAPERVQGTRDEEILCRLSNARKRGERQADYLAACLLMPEAEIRQAYRQTVSDRPLILLNRQGSVCGRGKPLWLEPVLAHVPYFAQVVIEQGGFTNVSRTAMSIRLQELGLLVNAVDNPRLGPA